MRIQLGVLLLGILLFTFVAVPTTALADDGSKDRVYFGGNHTIGEEETIEGNLIVFGSNVVMRGKVNGDVVTFGGNVDVDGSVGGSVVAMGGTTHITSKAVVEKDTVAIGGRLTRAEGARVHGSVVSSPGDAPGKAKFGRWPFSDPFSNSPANPFHLFSTILQSFFTALFVIGLGIAAFLVLPRHLERVGTMIESEPGQSAGIGCLTMIVAAFLTPILVITIIGIPVAVVVWIALALASLFGFFAIGKLVGEWLCRTLQIRPNSPLVIPAFGMAMVFFVLVPLQLFAECLNWLVSTIILLPGLGAVVLTRFGTVGLSRTAGMGPTPQAPSSGTVGPFPPSAPDHLPPHSESPSG